MSQPEPASLPEPAWTPSPGDVVAGEYRIGGLIGRGGMGAVFHAVHLTEGRPVAVKWVLPDRDRGRSRERLLREAALTRRIDHPNVVQVHQVGEEHGSIFLVMELLQGDALESWVLRGPCVPPMAIQIMYPVMRGVQASHAAGVVHRDLKPHNVILCEEPAGYRPTLIDFGISRAAEDGVAGDVTVTQTGVMVGTPLYMAPEQLAGRDDTDHRLDVYALGVILYELLSGGSPFEAEKYGPLLTEKLTRAAIPLSAYLPEVDPALERVVMRALERNPDKRYASVTELGEALEPFAGGPSFAEPESLYRGPKPGAGESQTLKVRRTARRKRRPVWPYVAAAAAILLAATALGAWLAMGESNDLAATELPREPAPVSAPPQPPPEPAHPEIEPDTPTVAETETEATEEADAESAAASEAEEPSRAAPGPSRRRRRGRRGDRRGTSARSGNLSVDDFL